ncbi:Uncharacterised protein [Mycolicibacterium smegmatis]|nr:Uncharacterised protein [Mycolicibacterium smegmatis]
MADRGRRKPRRRPCFRDTAAVQILHHHSDGRPWPTHPRTDSRHRGGEQGRCHTHHDLRPTPSRRHQLQSEGDLHRRTSSPGESLRHRMTESEHGNTVDLFVPAEPRPGLVAPPLRVVRKTGQHADIMAAIDQAFGQTGRIRSDPGRLRGIVDPENRHSHRSLGHPLRVVARLPTGVGTEEADANFTNVPLRKETQFTLLCSHAGLLHFAVRMQLNDLHSLASRSASPRGGGRNTGSNREFPYALAGAWQ